MSETDTSATSGTPETGAKPKNYESESRYGQVNGAMIREILPEMFEINSDKFFRGFEEWPEYEHTSTEDAKPITKHDLFRCDSMGDLRDRKMHVMLVGPVGSGKSTILSRFARDVSEGKMRDLFKDDFLVFIMNCRLFHGIEVIMVSDFLFRDMFKNEAKETTEVGFKWMLNNSEKVLFVLDSLDTIPYEFDTNLTNIDPYSESSPAVILHNIIAGNIFPKCKILSSSREYRARKYQGRLCPDRIVQMGELTDHSVRTLMRGYLGKQHFQTILNFWKKELPGLVLLNKSPGCLMYNMMTVGMEDNYQLSDTMPMTMLNITISCLNSILIPTDNPDISKTMLPILNKMKELAFYGTQNSEYLFTRKEVLEQFNIKEHEIETACIAFPGRHETKSPLIETKNEGIYLFMDHCVQEFFCAMKIVEMPLDEFQIFLEEFLHKPPYYVIRRMVCALILDPDVYRPASETGLIRKRDDFERQQEMLCSSMAEEFHQVKRRDLLEYFHAVRDSRVGMKKMIPRVIDSIDMSHIHLFSADMQAIGACLSEVNLNYLNLSNCGLSGEGMEAFAKKILYKQTKIKRFNLDWNVELKSCIVALEALTDIIKHTDVKDLSMNHCNFCCMSLHTFNLLLGPAKIKTLRLRHNNSLGDKGFSVLGDLVIRHSVDHLYVANRDLTSQRIENLGAGLQKFSILIHA